MSQTRREEEQEKSILKREKGRDELGSGHNQ